MTASGPKDRTTIDASRGGRGRGSEASDMRCRRKTCYNAYGWTIQIIRSERATTEISSPTPCALISTPCQTCVDRRKLERSQTRTSSSGARLHPAASFSPPPSSTPEDVASHLHDRRVSRSDFARALGEASSECGADPPTSAPSLSPPLAKVPASKTRRAAKP